MPCTQNDEGPMLLSESAALRHHSQESLCHGDDRILGSTPLFLKSLTTQSPIVGMINEGVEQNR